MTPGMALSLTNMAINPPPMALEGPPEFMFLGNTQNNISSSMVDLNLQNIVDDATSFDFSQQPNDTTSWYSSSSEESFYHFDKTLSSTDMSLPVPPPVLVPKSAFLPYVRADVGSSLGYPQKGQTKQKRCIQILRDVDHKRKERQRLSIVANIQEQEIKLSLQNKAAFHHMIAERNRRVKLKEHFQLLHSFLPSNSKKDKYSILSNTGKYLSELLKRVNDLEQANRVLHKSLEESSAQVQIENEECVTLEPLLYSSEEILVQKCKAEDRVKLEVNSPVSSQSSSSSLTILLLETLRELKLDAVSIRSSITNQRFQAHVILLRHKEDDSNWNHVAEAVKKTVLT